MRIIPKTSKVKLTIYKNLTLADFIVGFLDLIIIAITVSSNFPYKWFIALAEVIVIIPFFISISGERIYEYIKYVFKFIASHKRFSNNAKNENKEISGIIPYRKVEDNLIINRDGSYVGILEIYPLDFRMLSIQKQDDYIDNVFSRVLNNICVGDEFQIVKLERPLILDGNIQDELDRLEKIACSYENGTLSDVEKCSRVNVIEDRISLIDEINSDSNVLYSRYYLCLISKSTSNIDFKLDRAKVILTNEGIQNHRLNDKELTAFIRYGINSNFDERSIDQVDDLESLFNPKDINFKLISTRQDNLNLTHFVINNFPLRVGNGWGEGLFDMENTKVVMRLKPNDKIKALNRIDNAIIEIGTTMQKGKMSEELERDTHFETLQDLLYDIQRDNETLFDVTLIITIYDEIGSNLNKKKVATRLHEMGFGYTEMLGRQMEAYISSFASLTNKVDISRGIQTSSIAACFPFVSNAILDKDGLLLGENKLPVFVDFFKRDDEHVNSNTIVIGKPGSGKSYATKMILANLSTIDSKIYVLDPENEYGILAKNLNGISFDVSNSNKGMINPFEIISSLDEDSSSYYSHLQFLEKFYRLILKGINFDSLELLNKCTQELYKQWNIDDKTDLLGLKSTDYPTFEDLYTLVENKLKTEKDEYTQNQIRVILNYISKFKSGGRNSKLWNGYSSFSPKENFVAFNFQKLLSNKNEVIANAQMLLILKWVENEVIKNREFNLKNNTNRKIIVAIDEAHLFIDEKHSVALDFMYQLAKRIRKYDGMLMIITQNIKDFTGTPDIARKSSAIINVSQYSLIFSLSPNDMNELCDLYKNAGEINEIEKDYIIHNPRGCAFLISSPNKRSNINIVASNYIESLFN